MFYIVLLIALACDSQVTLTEQPPFHPYNLKTFNHVSIFLLIMCIIHYILTLTDCQEKINLNSL